MPPTPERMTRAPTSRRAELVERAVDRFDRALHVALDDEREFLAARGLELRHHLFERAAHAGLAGGHHVALLAHAIIGDFARAAFAIDHGKAVAGIRRAVEAQHLDRNGRSGRRHGCAGIVDQRAHAARFGAGNDQIADLERAALHQHGRDRAAAAIELGFDHGAFGRAIRIGLEVENFGLQPDGLEQLLEIHLLGRRHLDIEHVAAERFHLDFVLQQFGAHALRLGVRLVHLVDGDDHRRFRGLGVIDGFDRLRHDAVIGRDHEHDDVGHLRAARAHRGERGVARRVDEGDLAVRRRRHLIGADMLGDAAGFAGGHLGLADGVEQRGLAVVDMAHDGDDRRARLQGRRIVGAFAVNRPSSTSDSATRLTLWPSSSAISCAVSASIMSLIVAMWPCFISRRMTSTPRSDMRLASSWIVMVSGMMTSRMSFSFGSSLAWPFRRCVRRRNEATERSRTSSVLSAVTSVRRPRCF